MSRNFHFDRFTAVFNILFVSGMKMDKGFIMEKRGTGKTSDLMKIRPLVWDISASILASWAEMLSGFYRESLHNVKQQTKDQ